MCHIGARFGYIYLLIMYCFCIGPGQNGPNNSRICSCCAEAPLINRVIEGTQQGSGNTRFPGEILSLTVHSDQPVFGIMFKMPPDFFYWFLCLSAALITCLPDFHLTRLPSSSVHLSSPPVNCKFIFCHAEGYKPSYLKCGHD